MPSKYSHSVVLASYSSRGIISLPNDEKLDNRKGLKAPRILPGRPPLPHESVFTGKPEAGVSSTSSYHARSSTLQPMSPARRSSKGQFGGFTGAKSTSPGYPKEEVFNHVRLKAETSRNRPPTSERQVILDSESEKTASGIAQDDTLPRTSGLSNGKPPTCSRLTSPFDPYVNSWELTHQRDQSRAQTNPADHTNNGILKRNEKLLSPVAPQKHDSSRDFRDGAQLPGRDILPLYRQPPALQHSDAEPLFAAGNAAALPQVTAMADTRHPRRQLISRKAVQHNAIRHAPMPETEGQTSKLQKPRRPSLSRANTSFIDLSDDETSSKSRGHTPHRSLEKSPSTHTLFSDIGVQDSAISNQAKDLLDLHGGVTIGPRREAQDKWEIAATGNDGLAEPKAQRRPVSMGSGHPEIPPLQKRAALHRRQTEELIRHSVSRSPVLESRNLSWLLLDVGPNIQMKDNYHDETQYIPYITLQLPKSEARAVVTNSSLGASVAQSSLPRLAPVEADFSKACDGNESEKSSVRGDEPLWSPKSAKSAPTSVESDGRQQPRFSHLSSCSVKPEPQPQTYQDVDSLASSGKPKLKPKFKSEEEMRMKIPTPIPSPSLSARSPEISGKRMVRSSSGSLQQASRPATMPEFGVPSVVRYHDQTPHVHEQTTSRPVSRLSSGTPQKQKIGPETLRKLASFSRFPRMASTQRQGKDATLVRAMESNQQDSDDWMLPNIPVSKEAASRASLLESLAATVEAESRLEHNALQPWHDLSPQFQNVASQMGDGSDVVDAISLFSNDHHIPLDVQDDYTNNVHAAGDEIEDPDAALPPPDISRYRADRTSSRNGQYRLSQSSLTALPRMANAKRSMSRLSWAKREGATEQTVWALNANPSVPLPARADISQEKEGKRPRMRTGMKAFWGRLRRCIES
ncbi:uncharacterized protein PV07_03316 [Cladophialophora immunda]|uniref:Uncharacterized protein n=1 Tax=Cladophialophora immunda TaxID=569365 RepID=A0A0D1ZUB9_9EURO|nr:uncharacterized protein PV07_03316 [Cladophialophora immunda]KIW31716.1 hypothetical protein PV07_03316 [Cladophialophora immunda]